MQYTSITITRELKRNGEIRSIEGMLHSDEMNNGCIFYIRKNKESLTETYKLLISRLYKTTPPIEVGDFPLYTITNYHNREMIYWIGKHAPQLIRMSIL